MNDRIRFELEVPADKVPLLRAGDRFRVWYVQIQEGTADLYRVTVEAVVEHPCGEEMDPSRISWTGP